MRRYIDGFDKYFGALILRLPDWMRPILELASFTGRPVVLILVASLIAARGYSVGQSAQALAGGVALLSFGGSTILKMITRRTRPDTLYVQNMKIKSYSFPSGHSFGSVVVYGLLAYLLYVYCPQPWGYALAGIIGVLLALTGISRVYLGAHFPSDVLAGWALSGISLYWIVSIIKP